MFLKYLAYMRTKLRYPGKSKDLNVMYFITGSYLFSISHIPQYCQTLIKGQFAQNSNATDSFKPLMIESKVTFRVAVS